MFYISEIDHPPCGIYPRKYAAANRFRSSGPGVMVAMAMYFYASRLSATAAKTPPPQSANSSSSSAGKRPQVPTTTAATAAGQQPAVSSEKVSRCVMKSGWCYIIARASQSNLLFGFRVFEQRNNNVRVLILYFLLLKLIWV